MKAGFEGGRGGSYEVWRQGAMGERSEVMCGNNHWIITPNLTRSIQIDSWPGGPKSYLWQPVIASPVIQQTKMEEPQTAVSALLGLVSVAY